jgi:hypothetical protein
VPWELGLPLGDMLSGVPEQAPKLSAKEAPHTTFCSADCTGIEANMKAASSVERACTTWASTPEMGQTPRSEHTLRVRRAELPHASEWVAVPADAAELPDCGVMLQGIRLGAFPLGRECSALVFTAGSGGGGGGGGSPLSGSCRNSCGRWCPAARYSP